MAEPSAHHAFPHLFTAPAAWCDAAGVIRASNAAFEEWAGPSLGARVEIHGARGVLLESGRTGRPLVMVGLADGGWLALGGVGEGHGAIAAVAAAIAMRLERVETSLESNAQIGLHEGPSEPVARCLRETLATAEEVRLLRRQVAALGANAVTERLPVCLRALVREAAQALRPLPIRVEAADGDYTVEVDRARFFHILVGLLDELAGAATAAEPLVVTLRSGDLVRVQITGPGMPGAETAEVAATRRFVAPTGGRVLVDPDTAVTVEVPAFARGFRVDGAFGTVLIVDDDESALAMMGAVLRRAGFRVLAAADGVAASSLLRIHRAEIVAIVADAVLPGRSGMELATEARRALPGLPVLLVSGHSSDLLGAADLPDLPILSKPFGARVLAERVRQMVADDRA